MSPPDVVPIAILLLALDVDLSRERGDAVHTRELARFLASRGNRVDLVTAPASGAAPSLGPNVHLHARPAGGDLATVRACARIARVSRSGVIYERRLSPKIAFGVSRLTGMPFVVEVNGTEAEAALQGREKTSPWRPVRQRVRRTMYRRAARVVAVTEGLAIYVREQAGLPADRVAVVSNGTDAERFAPIDRPEARKRVGLPAAAWIVFVGNLVPWQGVEVAVRAMPAIVAEHRTAKLAIIGDGMLRWALGRLAGELGVGDAVRMLGEVPHSDVPAYIGAAEACVAPFTRIRNEAIGLSPLKVYEYMACARPVVASAVPGIVELLGQSGGGIAVAPDDPKALASAVSRLLSHPEEGRTMGERGRRYVLAECTWERTAARVERILRESIAGP